MIEKLNRNHRNQLSDDQKLLLNEIKHLRFDLAQVERKIEIKRDSLVKACDERIIIKKKLAFYTGELDKLGGGFSDAGNP